MIRANSSFVPTPSVAAASSLPSPIEKSPREAADASGDLGPACPGRQIGDERHCFRGSLGVHTRGTVSLAHGSAGRELELILEDVLPGTFGDLDRVLAVETRPAEGLFPVARGGDHPVERQVPERVRAHV